MLPRLLALLALCLVVGFLVTDATQRNAGDFTYPLDDTYIHLAVAKNLGAHGTWGINPGEFSSCTSSILWPLLLALFGAAMPWGEQVPLALNFLASAAVIVFVDRWLRELAVGRLVRLGVLLGFVLVVPLGVLTVLGLEHVLQVGLALALLRWGTERMEGPDPGTLRRGRGLVFALLLVATRFEGLFLVAALAWFLRRAGRRRDAAAILLAGLLPVLAFGAFSLLLGGRFLPTPLWMKGRLSSELLPALQAAGTDPGRWFQILAGFLLFSPLRSLAEVGVLAWLVLLGLARLIWTRPRAPRRDALGVVLLTIWLHLCFARTGWVGRYEAWLIAILSIVLAPFAQRLLDSGFRRRWPLQVAAVLALLAFGAMPVRQRVASTMFQANRGSTNIHEQQVQMARFFDRYRSGEAVGVNDIGAVAYFADVKCVDLWGLSNLEIAELRVAGELDPLGIQWEAQVRNVGVVAMYESVLAETGGVPGPWRAVADWRIQRNAVCGSSRLTWFATSPDAVPRLRAQLQAFAPALPGTVDVRWRDR